MEVADKTSKLQRPTDKQASTNASKISLFTDLG